MEVRLLIAALRRRLLLILMVGVIGGSCGVGYALADQGQYEATAQLLLDPGAVVVPDGEPFTGDPERFVGGQIGVLRSRATAERAARDIAVSADDVSEAVTVEHIVGTDVVDVVARADSAGLARDIANAVADTYVAQRAEISAAAVQAQVQAVQDEIADVEQQLAALPTGLSQPDPRQQVVVNQYEQLLQRRLALTAPGAVRDATAVLDPARLPEAPNRLSPVLAGAAGTLLGLLLGTALAALLEGRRPHVTTRLQAEHLLGRAVHAVFPSRSRRGRQGPVDHHFARVLLALVNANPVSGRRVIALCATGAPSALERLAAALVDVETQRGAAVQLLHRDLRDRAGSAAPSRPARRADVERSGDTEQEDVGSLLVQTAPARRASGVQDVIASVSPDVDIAVLVLPQVLDDPSIADVARWATDVVLLVPLGEQGESDLSTAQQLLTAGPARLHPVLVTKSAGARART